MMSCVNTSADIHPHRWKKRPLNAFLSYIYCSWWCAYHCRLVLHVNTTLFNKKVLLRERKRHTARRVVSTPSAVLTGYPPILTWWGVAYLGTPHPDLAGGYPTLVPPQQGTPSPTWTWQGTPRLDLAGYPPPGPGRVPPQLPHGILGNVAKHYGIWVPPLWTDRRTDTCQNITFPSYYVRGR